MLPTNARTPMKIASLIESEIGVLGMTFHKSHKIGWAQQTAQTEP